MGANDMVKKLTQTEWIRRAFGSFLDKKSLDERFMESFKKEKPEEKKCGYFIFEIMQDENFENILNNLIEYSAKNEFQFDIYGTIVIVYLTKMIWNQNNELNIEKETKKYIENMPENIKINIRVIYGIENAKVGIFGSNIRMTHMILLKDYYKKLLELDTIEYGEAKKLN